MCRVALGSEHSRDISIFGPLPGGLSEARETFTADCDVVCQLPVLLAVATS